MQQKISVVGIYPVTENEEVHLIELIVQGKASEFDVIDFTQENPNQHKENWQVAYDEYYLNDTGDLIIGNSIKLPESDMPITRLVFYLYFVDFGRPLLTPFGEVELPKPSSIPKRLQSILQFVEAD